MSTMEYAYNFTHHSNSDINSKEWNYINHSVKTTNMSLTSKSSCSSPFQIQPNSNLTKTVPFVSTNLKPTITITPTASTFPTFTSHLHSPNSNTLQSQYQSQLSNNNQSTHQISSNYTNQSIYFPKVNIIDSNFVGSFNGSNTNTNLKNTKNINNANFHNVGNNNMCVIVNDENDHNKRNGIKETQYEFQQQLQSSFGFNSPQSQNFNNHHNNGNVDDRSSIYSPNNNTQYEWALKIHQQAQTSSPIPKNSNDISLLENDYLSQFNDVIKQKYDEYVSLCVVNKEYMNRVEIYEQLPFPIAEGLLLNEHVLHVLYYEYIIHNFLLSSNDVLQLQIIEENALERQILVKLGEVCFLDHINDSDTHSFQFIKTKNSKLWHIYLRLIDVERFKHYYGIKFNINSKDKWDAWNKKLNDLNNSKSNNNCFYQACNIRNSELQFMNFVEKLKQINECYEKPLSECQMPKLSVLSSFQQIFFNVKNNINTISPNEIHLLSNNKISSEQNDNRDNTNEVANPNPEFQQYVVDQQNQSPNFNSKNDNLSPTPNGDNVGVISSNNVDKEELNKKNTDNNCAFHKRLRPSKHQELVEQRQQQQKAEMTKQNLKLLNDMDLRFPHLRIDKPVFDQTEGIDSRFLALETSLPTQQENISSQNLVDFNNVSSTPQEIGTQNQYQHNNVNNVGLHIHNHTDDDSNDHSNCFQFPTQPVHSQPFSLQQQHQPSYAPTGYELNQNDLMVNNSDNNDQPLLMNSIPTISTQSPSPASTSPTSSSVSSAALQSPFPWANVAIQNSNSNSISISISNQDESRKELPMRNNQQSSHTFYNNTLDSLPNFVVDAHPKSSHSTLLNMFDTIRYDHRPTPPSRIPPQLNNTAYKNELTSMYSNTNRNHSYSNNSYHKRNRNNQDYQYNYRKWRKAVEYERAPRHQKYAYN